MWFSSVLHRAIKCQPAVVGGTLTLGIAAMSPHLCGQSAIYVTDANSQKVTAYNLATQQPYAAGSALATTFFGFGSSVATDSSGNVYVGFVSGGDNITKFNSAGALVTSFGSGGTVSPGANTMLGTMAVNPAGTSLLVPFNANLNQILGFDTGTGSAAGGFTTVNLNNPTGLAFNPSGTFFYASMPSGAFQGTTITRYSPSGGTGTILTFTGGGFANNGFDNAKGLLFQSDTSLLVVSTSLHEIERYTLSGTTATLDASFGTSGGVSINFLTGSIAADASGNIYVTTTTAIEQLSANGVILNSSFIADANSPGQIAIGVTAIPEPSAYAALAGVSAFGVGWWVRRCGKA